MRPADIRTAAVLAVALLAASFVVPGWPFVGLPLAAFALAWFAYRTNVPVSVAAAIASTVIIVVVARAAGGVDPSDAVFLAAGLLLAGPGTAVALTRWPAVPVVAVLTVALTAIALAGIALTAQSHGLTVTGEVRRQVDASIDVTGTIKAAQPSVNVTELRSRLNEAKSLMVRVMPAYMFAMMGLSALLVVVVVTLAGRITGAPVSSLPPLQSLDLSFHLVWPAIAGLVLLAFGAATRHPAGVEATVGLNLLLIVRPALALQGAGVFAALYRRGSVGRFGRGVGYVLLAVSETIIPSVSLLGMVDLFFNLRKLPRGSAEGTAPAS